MKYVILTLILTGITFGCVTTKPVFDVDTRGLHGKMMVDTGGQRGYIVEYAEDGKYYLHDLSPSGGILFRK